MFLLSVYLHVCLCLFPSSLLVSSYCPSASLNVSRTLVEVYFRADSIVRLSKLQFQLLICICSSRLLFCVAFIVRLKLLALVIYFFLYCIKKKKRCFLRKSEGNVYSAQSGLNRETEGYTMYTHSFSQVCVCVCVFSLT